MTTRLPSQEKPWLKHFPKESLDIALPKCRLYEYLKATLVEHPNKIGIHYYGTDVKNKDIVKRIDEAANSFKKMGIKKGDIVSFLTVTTPETIYAMYGLNKLGAICNFIDPRMDISRIRTAIADVNSTVLITLDLPWPKVERILGDVNLKHIIVVTANDSLPGYAKVYRKLTVKATPVPYSETVIKWADFMKSGKGTKAKMEPYEENSTAIITYTGGTTGIAKGVMLTDDGLNAVAYSFRYSGVDMDTSTDNFLDIMPVFASYGVVCGIHMPMAFGFKNILCPQFTPDTLGKLIKKYKANAMMGVPSFYERIMHSRDLWDVDLSYLKVTGCGGDTMNPGLEERFNKFMKEHGAKYPLSQGYGMSEVTGAATCCFNNVYKDSSAGFPLLAVTVGIFEPGTTNEVGYGVEGEVCLSGPTVMKGYYENQAETDNILITHPDGTKWIHSGDIGYLDEEGFLFINGRIKHMICRFDGHKVFPVSIEAVVGKHKAVGTCCVVGIPDPDRAQGEMPLVIVELKHTLQGEVDQAQIRQEIMDLCEKECEERGRPIDVTFIDEMPHTLMGKNDFATLSKMYKDYKVQR